MRWCSSATMPTHFGNMSTMISYRHRLVVTTLFSESQLLPNCLFPVPSFCFSIIDWFCFVNPTTLPMSFWCSHSLQTIFWSHFLCNPTNSSNVWFRVAVIQCEFHSDPKCSLFIGRWFPSVWTFIASSHWHRSLLQWRFQTIALLYLSSDSPSQCCAFRRCCSFSSPNYRFIGFSHRLHSSVSSSTSDDSIVRCRVIFPMFSFPDAILHWNCSSLLAVPMYAISSDALFLLPNYWYFTAIWLLAISALH